MKAKLEKDYPDAEVEIWAFDEHRVGLKPIWRQVWSPIGSRPMASVHHRYQWTYVYGFVCPTTGATECYILPGVNIDWFNLALLTFAKAIGAGATKRILLTIDGAGWHRSGKVKVPDGIHLELLPPYSPELQPAERLWPLMDEPLVNQCFDTIEVMEDLLVERCLTLANSMHEPVRHLTQFHWWPV